MSSSTRSACVIVVCRLCLAVDSKNLAAAAEPAARSLARPGILVIDPAGKELAFIPTGPTHQSGLFEDWKGIPSNVEFGIGEEGNRLYVTIDKSLYRIRLKVRAFHLPMAAK